MTAPELSKAERYGVGILSLPCGFLEFRSHSVTVSSLPQDTKASLAGERAKQVTWSVTPVKYRM